jgi:AcrR family transcriptional regulator
MTAPVPHSPVRKRRPRDRRAQIIAAAGPRFHEAGYHNVSTEAIATAVGITAGALYRHFRNKRELLAATINDGLDRAAEAVTGTGPGDLDSVITALVEVAVERRDLGVLWKRESRYLNDTQREEARIRFQVIPTRLAGVIQDTRPELSPDEADFLTWALMAVLTSPSYHAAITSKETMNTVLHRMARAVGHATTFPGEREDITDGDVSAGLPRGSRRETLLAVATRLFDQRGYQAVTMKDVGAATGITSASIYNHFRAKSDLLAVALIRGADSLQLDMTRALANSTTPRDALDTLVWSYVDFALSHRDLIGALVTEVVNLPSPLRHTIRQLQHDYVSEWIRLLLADQPDRGAIEARFLTHAALTVINDVARTRHLAARPRISDELHSLTTELIRAH